MRIPIIRGCFILLTLQLSVTFAATENCPKQLDPAQYSKTCSSCPEKYTAFREAFNARQVAPSIEYANQLVELAKTFKDYELLSCLYEKLRFLYSKQSNYQEAIAASIAYTELPDKYQNGETLCEEYGFLSEMYSQLGLWEEAYNYHLKAKDCVETVSPAAQARIYYRSGTVFYYQERYHEAIEFYQKSLWADTSSQQQRVRALGALTTAYLATGQLDVAERTNRLELAAASDIGVQAHALACLGDLKIQCGQLDSATIYLNRAVDLFTQRRDIRRLAEAWLSLAIIAEQNNDQAKAITYLSNITSSERLPYFPIRAKADKALARIYGERGDIALAWTSLNNYHQEFEQQGPTEATEAKLEALHVGHQLEKKEQEVLRYALERKLYLVALLSSLVIVAILIYTSWVRRRAHRNEMLQKEQIEQQNRSLLAYNQRLESFNRIVSHDLKEPLRTANTWLGFLRTRYQKALPPRAQDDFAMVEQSVQQGYNMVESLLYLTTLEKTNAEQFSWSNSYGPLHNAIQQLDTLIKETGAIIQIEPDIENWPQVHVVEHTITALWQNLIANACKFVSAGVQPIMKISVSEEKHFFRFAIQDNGIGIPEGAEEEIFAMFNRLHARADYEGSGIGLATCRRIVGIHGGQIQVKPNPCGGTIFWYTIPKKTHHQPQSSEKNALVFPEA